MASILPKSFLEGPLAQARAVAQAFSPEHENLAPTGHKKRAVREQPIIALSLDKVCSRAGVPLSQSPGVGQRDRAQAHGKPLLLSSFRGSLRRFPFLEKPRAGRQAAFILHGKAETCGTGGRMRTLTTHSPPASFSS